VPAGAEAVNDGLHTARRILGARPVQPAKAPG